VGLDPHDRDVADVPAVELLQELRDGATVEARLGGPVRDEFENPLRMLGQAAWQALMVLGLAAIAVGVCAVVWPGRRSW